MLRYGLRYNKVPNLSAWQEFISNVQQHLLTLEDSGCDCPFFRGHSESSWALLCGLGRRNQGDFKKENLESVLYYDFLSQAGPLLHRPDSSWDVLFSMQHHGLPTRLLDWSATFAVGLYFALKPHLAFKKIGPSTLLPAHEPCVWVLDPFELNRAMSGESVVLNPEIDLEGTYQEIFIEESKSLGAKVMAVNPTQAGKRLAAQRGCFTLHADLFSPLEINTPSFLRKFVLPKEAVAEGLGFLRLAGMNEYSVFPDLDGLARHLREIHVD
jgi:hypothetical protein